MYQTIVKQAIPRLTASIGILNARKLSAALSAIELTGSLARHAHDTGPGDGFAAVAPIIFESLGRDV